MIPTWYEALEDKNCGGQEDALQRDSTWERSCLGAMRARWNDLLTLSGIRMATTLTRASHLLFRSSANSVIHTVDGKATCDLEYV